MEMPEITISGEKLFAVFGLDVTNTFFWSIIIGIFVFVFFYFSLRNGKIIPQKIQNFAEFILESLFNFMDSITNSREKTKEIFPIAATLFVFIFTSNIVGLAPGLGVFHLLRAPSSDLHFTFALALFSIVFMNYLIVKRLGASLYLSKFINFKNPIAFGVGILEGISEITKIFSLAFRLFGNIFAGEVLLIVTSFLFAFILPLPFLGFEILVGLIQAFIFSSLIVIFYASSTEHAHG